MRRTVPFIILIAATTAVVAVSPDVHAQSRRSAPAPRLHAAPAERLHRGHESGAVFIGGYFYDPFFGPYPWWPRAAYPYPYYPLYDDSATLRVLVTPKDAAVYVDGFYAGIVDDFNGFFQGLPLPPGGHEVVLYLEGDRTVHERVYLAPGSTFKLRDTMRPLRAGESSEPPPVAAPVPLPPVDTYAPPRTPGPSLARPQEGLPQAAQPGTLALRVRPEDAEVSIDGQRWTSSDGEHFILELTSGQHRVEVFKAGYQRLSTVIQVHVGETTPLNVNLTATKP